MPEQGHEGRQPERERADTGEVRHLTRRAGEALARYRVRILLVEAGSHRRRRSRPGASRTTIWDASKRSGTTACSAKAAPK